MREEQREKAARGALSGGGAGRTTEGEERNSAPAVVETSSGNGDGRERGPESRRWSRALDAAGGRGAGFGGEQGRRGAEDEGPRRARRRIEQKEGSARCVRVCCVQ